MDTKTLKVGQDVYMVSGFDYNKGKVVEVTPKGIIVQLARSAGPVGQIDLIRFDTNGKACDSSDIYKGNMWGGNDPRIPGMPEGGLWELSDDEQVGWDYEHRIAQEREKAAEARRMYEAKKK